MSTPQNKLPVIQWKKTQDQIRLVDVLVVSVLILSTLYSELAVAAEVSPFSGVTEFLKSIANLLILEWGYYIGIITLAIQGYRWKTGRIDLMELGGWGLGIGLVFFAPNIVADLKSHAGSIN